MLIDWFTVGAQVINFLVLVWLLKRFLYKPVLKAIDAREKSVAAELTAAAAKRTAADRDGDEFRRKSKSLDEERNAVLATAEAAAKLERDRLVAEARTEAVNLSSKLADARHEDQAQLTALISDFARHEVFAIARKALADLAASSLEERMGDVLARRLRDLDGNAKRSLATALKSDHTAVVRSTFEMPPAERATIQDALNRTLSAEVPIRFSAAADTICGIELTANGYKLSWSIADYLTTLEQHVASLATDGARVT